MKFHVRLGSATLAGVFALSAIGAAQAEIEDPSETPTTELSTDTPDVYSPAAPAEDEPSGSAQPTTVEPTDGATELPLPPPPSSSEEPTSESPSSIEVVRCDPVELGDTTVLVDIPVAESGDFVQINGVGKHRVDASSQVSLPHEGEESLELTILRGEVRPPYAKCSVEFSLEDAEPSDEPSEEGTEGSQNPDDSDTATPNESPDPTTSAPEPEPSPPESTPPAPPENIESADAPPQQPAPSTSQAPVEPAPPQYNHWDNGPTSPTESAPQPSQEPTGRVERNIRQHSDNPRHLLSQIWNTDSHNGSGLIMPRPRDHSAEATELETLPPVSEDELDAIKARVSTPDKGNGLASDDLLRADVNERLTHSDTWWFVSSIVGLGVLGAGVWWAVARRKPRH